MKLNNRLISKLVEGHTFRKGEPMPFRDAAVGLAELIEEHTRHAIAGATDDRKWALAKADGYFDALNELLGPYLSYVFDAFHFEEKDNSSSFADTVRELFDAIDDGTLEADAGDLTAAKERISTVVIAGDDDDVTLLKDGLPYVEPVSPVESEGGCVA